MRKLERNYLIVGIVIIIGYMAYEFSSGPLVTPGYLTIEYDETYESGRTEVKKVMKVDRIINARAFTTESNDYVHLIGTNIHINGDETPAEVLKRYIQKGTTVELEFDLRRQNHDGHLLAYVYVPFENNLLPLTPPISGYVDNSTGRDRYFLNATLIYEGYAKPHTMRPNVKYVELFKDLYEEAREYKRGVWKEDQVVKKKKKEEPVACTMDAKRCPDGSYVGRIPPDCRFKPCPGEKKDKKRDEGSGMKDHK